MKKYNPKFTLLVSLCLLIASLNGFSQPRPGFIIDNENDTTYGYIHFVGSIKNSSQCRFISMPDSTLHAYAPGDINGFRFIDGKYFTTEEISFGDEKREVFIEWLLKGKASLLTYSAPDTEVRYFLLPEGDSLHELVNTKHYIDVRGVPSEHQRKEYVGSLLYYLKDCPSIKADVENVTLSTKPLMKLAREYHEITCPGEECLIFEDKTRKTRLEIGATTDMVFSQLRFNNVSVKEAAEMTNSFGFGIGFNFSNLPLVSPKFSISISLAYHHPVYKYNVEEASGWVGYIETENRITEFSNIRVPIQVNYLFTQSKFSPYISAGAVVNLRFGFKEYNEFLLRYVTNHDGGYDLGFTTAQIGITPGCGLRYSVSPKTAVNIGFNYEYAFKFFGTWNMDKSVNNNYVIQASFFYKLK